MCLLYQILKMCSCLWVLRFLLTPSRLGKDDESKCRNTLTCLPRSTIQDTLIAIPDRAHTTTVRESVLGSALCAALAALVRASFLALGFCHSSR